MKKIILMLKNRIVLYFILIIFLASIPYFIAYFKAPKVNTYALRFETTEEIEAFNITKEEIESVKTFYVNERNEEINQKGSSKKVDFSFLDVNKVYNDLTIYYNDDYYEISCSQGDFTSQNMAKKMFTKILKNKADIVTNISENIYKNDKINALNIFLYSLIISFFVVSLIYIVLFFTYKKFYNLELEYDNFNMYRTPLHLNYWKNQLSWLFDLKKMTFLAMLFALELSLKLIHLPSGFANLGIGFSYVIFSIIGMLFGPITGVIIGFLSDILGYAISPSVYGFFFPYTLNAMLAGFVYGLCFYKTNINYTKCFISRLFVNLFINVFLGSIWWGMITGLDYNGIKNYMLFMSLPKNLVYLIPQSVLQFVALNALKNPMYSLNLIDLKIRDSFRVI